uniref:Ycf54 n=1 Tax=Kuetzingia canaliculata TaxID=228262 RepID=A0A1Z1MPK8_KUECA|nr:hypothetical protein [Kuetzingia canaliculata]ARW67782.1 hypothetical protein [Kuetzingia canaliculata]
MYKYYFAAASQNFFLKQEPVEEILRERTQYYKSNNKDIDFWFVLSPNFIKASENIALNPRMNDSMAAIISLDQEFINWLKLRISFVQIGSFQSNSIFIFN